MSETAPQPDRAALQPSAAFRRRVTEGLGALGCLVDPPNVVVTRGGFAVQALVEIDGRRYLLSLTPADLVKRHLPHISDSAVR